MTMVLDIPNDAASIPGKGDTKITFTHTSDVAKFVAASLDLSNWDKVSYVIGDKASWNEVLKLAEDAKGTKFKVVYDSTDKLQRGEATELPSHTALYGFLPKPQFQAVTAIFGLWSEHGRFDLDETKALNRRLPSLTTIGVAKIVKDAWGS